MNLLNKIKSGNFNVEGLDNYLADESHLILNKRDFYVNEMTPVASFLDFYQTKPAKKNTLIDYQLLNFTYFLSRNLKAASYNLVSIDSNTNLFAIFFAFRCWIKKSEYKIVLKKEKIDVCKNGDLLDDFIKNLIDSLEINSLSSDKDITVIFLDAANKNSHKKAIEMFNQISAGVMIIANAGNGDVKLDVDPIINPESFFYIGLDGFGYVYKNVSFI